MSQSEMKIFSSRFFIQEFVFFNSFLKITVLSLIFSSLPLTIYSQPIFEKGYSTIINYSYKDYDHRPQNHAIIQDKRGVMYFGNNEGILEFNGTYWRKKPIHGQSGAKNLISLKSGENRKYFTGAGTKIFGWNPILLLSIAYLFMCLSIDCV